MIDEIFLKHKKTNITKNGLTTEKWVLRTCDECGKKEEVRYGTIVSGRKKRNKVIDVCKKCGYLAKYRSSIFSKTMEQAVNWKGGRSVSGNGYKLIYVGSGKRIFKHVKIYEDYVGRKLSSKECIHHIDLNKINNKINNLFLCKNKSVHMSCHHSLREMAIYFLNEMIWFDLEKKSYTTKKLNIVKKIIESNIVIPKSRIYTHKIKRKNKIIKYQRFYTNDNKYKYKYIHICVMEKMMGRKMYASECVHHINGDTLDNNINNLCVLTRREHSFAHKSLEDCGSILYKREHIKFKNGFYYV